MQMQQLIKSARRATPRTLIASQQKKWTLRKPLISRCGWIEEKKKDRSRRDCRPSRGRNSKLSSSISGDLNKMKIRHELKVRVYSSVFDNYFVDTISCNVVHIRSSVIGLTRPKVFAIIV